MSNNSSRAKASKPTSSREGPQQASGRSNCYGLMALVFRDAPSPEVVEQLRSPPIADALSGLGYDAAEDLTGDLEAVTERLREEYSRVFVGPGGHVSPFGSVHHEDEGQLWGESTVQVKRFIEATGLSFEGNWESIPDHIAIQLELMQRLAAHEAELWSKKTSADPRQAETIDRQLHKCLEVEEQFLRDHLCTWVPRFCDRTMKTSACAFYQEIARLTSSFVVSDLDQVAATIRSLRPGRRAGRKQREEQTGLKARG